MKDDQFGNTKEYDPASYWDARATASCGNTYEAVCAYGLSNAENWAMERVQSATLKKYLPTLGPQSSILEVGCGVGRWVPVFTDIGARYTGVDVSDEMLKLARERIGGDSSFHKTTSSEWTQPPFSGPVDMLGFPLNEREIYEEETFWRGSDCQDLARSRNNGH